MGEHKKSRTHVHDLTRSRPRPGEFSTVHLFSPPYFSPSHGGAEGLGEVGQGSGLENAENGLTWFW